jgi:hypothetical protein
MNGMGISQEVDNGGQVCGDMEVVVFPLQNVYKMTYCDENATFKSRCKRETFEPVNGYKTVSTFDKFVAVIFFLQYECHMNFNLHCQVLPRIAGSLMGLEYFPAKILVIQL